MAGSRVANLKGYRVSGPDGRTSFASFDALDVNGSDASIYRLAPVIDQPTLTGLQVHVIRELDSHCNASDIAGRLPPEQVLVARAAPRVTPNPPSRVRERRCASMRDGPGA